MAIVEQFFASVQVAGSKRSKAGKALLASASIRVGAADARAYIAAANQAARDATKVGLLLDSLIDGTVAAGSDAYKKWNVQSDFVNDAFTPPDEQDNTYNHNMWKVTGLTTNAGIPAYDSFTIPQRNEAWLMESDGVHVDLTDTEPANLIVQVLDTGLSQFGTPFTAITEIVAND
jgi:hypothetical protein